MKTLLINIADSNIAKNILRTNVLKTLKENNGLKIVLLVPRTKVDVYDKEFSADNVLVEGWPDILPSFLEKAALFLAKNSLPTHAVRQIQEVGFDGGSMRKLPYFFARVLWLLGHLGIWRRLVSKVAIWFFNDSFFGEIFNNHKPDLIFTHTIYSTNDLRLLKHSMKNRIKTIGMIKSWDNLTSKDPLIIKPDWLIVHNEIIKKEAIKIGKYPESRIFISGIPQFDFYADRNFTSDRENFFSEMKISPDKKLVTFLAVGSCLMLHEKEMIEMLSDIINSGELVEPAQLLVRLHPAFTSDEKKISLMPNVIVDRPGKNMSSTKVALRDGWEFDTEETKKLANTLKWSDVTLSCGSTTLLESAIYSTPTIIIGFDAVEEKNYWRSAKRLLNREHMLPVLSSGGARLVKNKHDMIEWLNKYLENKEIDKDGRVRLIREQCYVEDGMAGKRIADFISSKIST